MSDVVVGPPPNALVDQLKVHESDKDSQETSLRNPMIQRWIGNFRKQGQGTNKNKER